MMSISYARKRLQHATMKSKDETRNSRYDRSASNQDILSFKERLALNRDSSQDQNSASIDAYTYEKYPEHTCSFF